MKVYIVLTFLVLGVAFYELSGGSDFKPEQASASLIQLNRDAVNEDGEPPFLLPEAVEVTEVDKPETDEPIVIQASLPVIEPMVIETTEEQELPEVAEAEVEETPEPVLDLRVVTASRVNMRAGPGTNFGIQDKLVRGTEVVVLETLNGEWSRLKVIESDKIGWIATRLLSDTVQ